MLANKQLINKQEELNVQWLSDSKRLEVYTIEWMIEINTRDQALVNIDI